jgi:hypothetical protein
VKTGSIVVTNLERRDGWLTGDTHDQLTARSRSEYA